MSDLVNIHQKLCDNISEISDNIRCNNVDKFKELCIKHPYLLEHHRIDRIVSISTNIIKYLHELNIQLNSETLNSAIWWGNIEGTRYLYEDLKIPSNEFTCHYAIKSNKLTIIKYVDEVMKLTYNENNLIHAIEYNKMPVIRYLYSFKNLNDIKRIFTCLFHNNINNDCYNYVKFLHEETNYDLQDDYMLIIHTIKVGNLKLLRYLSNIITFNTNNYSLLEYAVEFGHVEILRYLHEELHIQRGWDLKYHAIKWGNLPCVKYIVGLTDCWLEMDLDKMADHYGHHHIAEYFHSMYTIHEINKNCNAMLRKK